MIPPTPTPAELAEFRRLYHARFGIHLSEQDALDKAIGVLVLVRFQHDRYNANRLPDVHP